MRKRTQVLFTIAAGFLFCLAPGSLDAQGNSESPVKKGSIRGRVIDAEVKSAIPQARIIIMGTTLEAITDANGEFTISDVPVGSYTLEISCPYYITQAKTDIVVKSSRLTTVESELRLDNVVVEKKEVTVTAGYFAASDQQPASSANFSYEEIRRAAGAAGDVSRIISGLPSIARTNDMMNNLVVRGGSPAENAFYIDKIEIPNINHYPVLGSTSGPIGLLNVDFIRDVNFYSGGFPPVYGDRLSSVMDIAFREGNREELDLQLELGMMGLGLVAEGPIIKNRGAWMFSARRSYLDLLIDLMGQGVPVHWNDFQAKLTYDLSPKNKLTFLGVAGLDDSGTKKKDALKDGESFYGELDTTEYSVGLNWLAMWGANGYSNTSISQSSSRYKNIFYHTVSEDLAQQGNNTEKALTLRNVNYYRFDEASKVQFGLEFKHLVTDYDYFLGAYTDVMGNSVPAVSRDTRVSADKYGAFFQYAWNPLARMTLNLGLRADYFAYNRKTHVSPRLSLSYKVSPKTSLEASAGAFYQQLPLILLLQKDDYKSLNDPVAYHFVLGFRQLLTENMQLTVEAYDKEYDHFPLDPDQPSLFIFDELFYSGSVMEHERLVDWGKARSYGIEFMIQKKLADRIYGLISCSYFRTRYRDLSGLWQNRVYDNRFIFSVEGGWKISPTWEFSLKWNYAGGAPFTPFDLEASQAANTGIFDEERINGARLPVYHSMNLRFDKRFYFRSSNLIISFSVWNVFNRKNVMAYYWNTIDQRPGMTLGWGLLPVLGIEFEF